MASGAIAVDVGDVSLSPDFSSTDTATVTIGDIYGGTINSGDGVIDSIFGTSTNEIIKHTITGLFTVVIIALAAKVMK